MGGYAGHSGAAVQYVPWSANGCSRVYDEEKLCSEMRTTVVSLAACVYLVTRQDVDDAGTIIIVDKPSGVLSACIRPYTVHG